LQGAPEARLPGTDDDHQRIDAVCKRCKFRTGVTDEGLHAPANTGRLEYAGDSLTEGFIEGFDPQSCGLRIDRFRGEPSVGEAFDEVAAGVDAGTDQHGSERCREFRGPFKHVRRLAWNDADDDDVWIRHPRPLSEPAGPGDGTDRP